jgi:hypothetical protein
MPQGISRREALALLGTGALAGAPLRPAAARTTQTRELVVAQGGVRMRRG